MSQRKLIFCILMIMGCEVDSYAAQPAVSTMEVDAIPLDGLYVGSNHPEVENNPDLFPNASFMRSFQAKAARVLLGNLEASPEGPTQRGVDFSMAARQLFMEVEKEGEVSLASMRALMEAGHAFKADMTPAERATFEAIEGKVSTMQQPFSRE
jgi:hypothetical protein